MPDFISTKHTTTFEEWHDQIMDYADLRGGSATDAEAWRDDYETGKTPPMLKFAFRTGGVELRAL